MKINREIVSSRQNESVKAVRALLEKKGRRRAGEFRFDGIKLFLDGYSKVEIVKVVLRYPVNERVESAVDRAIAEGALAEEKILFVSESVFEGLTDESSPEGIITVAKYMTGLHSSADADSFSPTELDGKRLLIAESLRDAGNMGTVMRSCATLGIDLLLLTDDCADIYNPKTVRSAMGALFRLPTLTIPVGELPRAIKALRERNRSVYAAALRENGKTVGKMTLRPTDCFVIGNEGHGLSDSVIEACTDTAIIPMTEGSESLNAAAAAAICIWETVRAAE
jgi:TrmH family RNA methyltransferase